jgi:hypothetical protein
VKCVLTQLFSFYSLQAYNIDLRGTMTEENTALGKREREESVDGDDVGPVPSTAPVEEDESDDEIGELARDSQLH